jgi:hypothetical protein
MAHGSTCTRRVPVNLPMPAAVQKSIMNPARVPRLAEIQINSPFRSPPNNATGQIPIDSAPRTFRLAVSSFGDFQTPAAQRRATLITCKPRLKTFTQANLPESALDSVILGPASTAIR